MEKKRPNVILLILDALRFDRLASSGYRPALTPTLDRLAAEGISCTEHFSVGCPTQISMPGIFSSTLPLDHHGYANGIAHRPRSFVEDLREAGYYTSGVVTAHWLSSEFGYGRGFDQYYEAIDPVAWMQGTNIEFLGELLQKREDGTLSEGEAVATLEREYPHILKQGRRYLDSLDHLGAPEHWRLRDNWRHKIRSEEELLIANPNAILNRKLQLGGFDYYGLGLPEVKAELLRKIEKVKKWDGRLNRYTIVRSRRGHCMAHHINRHLPHTLRRIPQQPFFMLLHFFDLHESKMLIPTLDAARIASLPGDVVKALKGRENYHVGGFIHDIALANIDRQVQRFINILDHAGRLKDTVLVITADHGVATQRPRRNIGSDLSRMFFDEYLRVPLILWGPDIIPDQVDSLMSHLDLGPTVLELAGLPNNMDFRGVPITTRKSQPADHLIFENTGKGRCEIDNKPIYLAIRNKAMKAIFECEGSNAREREVFDLSRDPEENDNLCSSNSSLDQRKNFADIARNRLSTIRQASGGAM